MRANLIATLLFLAACAPSNVALQKHLNAGQSLLAEQKYIAAEREFRKAEDALFYAPSDRGTRAVQDGLAHVDAALIESAVQSTAAVVDEHDKTIAELHRLHTRLRSLGGNASIAEKIVLAINMRVSLLLDPHEASAELSDLSAVLPLARYPELSDDNRARLLALSGKAWRVLHARATGSIHTLVQAVFTGLAANYSGAQIAQARALRRAELAPYSRGTKMIVASEADCKALAQGGASLDRQGVLQVDVSLKLSDCSVTSTSESYQVQQSYTENIPYQSTENYEELVCVARDVPVQYCENPYLGNGCTSSSRTVKRYGCHKEARRGTVTR